MTLAASSDLLSILASRGAVLETSAEGADVSHFGSAHDEYLDLTGNCGWVVRSWSSRLDLTGADRVRFLNAMMTCDIRSLEPGEGTYGFFTGSKGRILSDAVVRACEDRLVLELPGGMVPEISEHLSRYVVADRVEMELPDDRVLVDLMGPGAAAWLSEETGEELPSGWGHRSLDLCGLSLRIGASQRFGGRSFSAWIDARGLDAILNDAASTALRPRPIGREAWEVVRVENGALLFGRDFGPANLPQETGLEDAVSYTKGCYLGQEVVARLHYRGQAQRGPRGLEIVGDALPAEGVELRFEGRAAGRLTSVVRSPARGGVFGLSLLHRRAWEAGSKIELGEGGEASVVDLD